MGLFFIIPLYFVKNSGVIPLYFIIFVVIIPLYFIKKLFPTFDGVDFGWCCRRPCQQGRIGRDDAGLGTFMKAVFAYLCIFRAFFRAILKFIESLLKAL